MRRLVVTEFMSLDGVMEDPGGAEEFDRGGWVFQFERGPEGDRFKMDELVNSEASCWAASRTRAPQRRGRSGRTGPGSPTG